MANRAASLFIDEVDLSYISHSEIMYGRAATAATWAPGFADEIRAAARAASDSATRRLATATSGDDLLGFAILELGLRQPIRFATLEDFFIARAGRGCGVGSKLLDWISDQCRAFGVGRLFLESGIRNEAAHAFFRNKGFEVASVVMLRDLMAIEDSPS